MVSFSEVTLAGRLTRDPQIRDVGGRPLTLLTVAVNRSYKDKNDKWQEKTSFIDVQAWGDKLSSATESLAKGQPIVVFGTLEQQTWETNGEKHSKLVVIAKKILPLAITRKEEKAEDNILDEGF